MDEAESLCDNIAIMINGRFVCYGSPAHLKATYGKGYTVMLKYDAAKERQIDDYLRETMPYMQRAEGESASQEDGAVEATFKIEERVDSEVVGGLSNLLCWLGHLKTGEAYSARQLAEPLVLDFGVTRSGLEQVFVEFAKHQINAENPN